MTLAELARLSRYDERTLRRDVESIAAKLRPLLESRTAAERVWILAALDAHLRGESFFSTENATFSRGECPVSGRRPQDDEHVPHVVESSSAAGCEAHRVFVARRRAGHLPRRFPRRKREV